MKNLTNRELLERVGIKAEVSSLGALFSGNLEDGGVVELLPYSQRKKINALTEIYARLGVEKVEERPVITCSDQVADLVRPMIGFLDHEEFWVMYCDGARKPIKIKKT